MRMRARSGSVARDCTTGKASKPTTDSLQEIGRPISEERERPRIPIRGRFVLVVRKASFSFDTETRASNRDANGFALPLFRQTSAPKHPAPNVWALKPSAGRAATEFRHEARKCCAAMLGAGGGRGLSKRGTHTDWRFMQAPMRSIIRTMSCGMGLRPIRCARHCRGVCPTAGEDVSR